MTKKALLTGSTGGLGSKIAQILAEDGWSLILVNRDQEQAQHQLTFLRSSFPQQIFDSFLANLMDIHDIRKVSQNIADAHPEINALYNIAGLLTDKRIMSPQKIEGHFALNAVASYMLIHSLRSQLKAAATEQNPAFIINFSTSAVNNLKTLDVTKLVNPDNIGGLMDAYAKSKAVLNVMACFLKDELLKDNIYIYSVDPGATKTQMTTNNQGMPWFVRLLVPLLFGDPYKQAKKLVGSIHSALQNKKNGIFISNGKIKNNPSFASDIQLQDDIRQLMDSLIK
ncbi:MAG: SDR family NAD(P)-dependent oxidoreductase [Pseudomonadota bacterium]